MESSIDSSLLCCISSCKVEKYLWQSLKAIISTCSADVVVEMTPLWSFSRDSLYRKEALVPEGDCACMPVLSRQTLHWTVTDFLSKIWPTTTKTTNLLESRESSPAFFQFQAGSNVHSCNKTSETGPEFSSRTHTHTLSLFGRRNQFAPTRHSSPCIFWVQTGKVVMDCDYRLCISNVLHCCVPLLILRTIVLSMFASK